MPVEKGSTENECKNFILYGSENLDSFIEQKNDGVKLFRRILQGSIEEFGHFFYIWTIFVATFTILGYITIVLPIYDEVYYNYYSQWIGVNILSDIVNILDMIIQSKKTYLSHGIEICNFMDTAKNYLHTSSFVLDLLAVIPLDIALIFRKDLILLRANKLVKIHRVLDFIRLTEVRTNFPNIFHVFKLSAACFILFHWNGCLYFSISKYYDFEASLINNWIFSYDKIYDPIVANCDSEFSCGLAENDTTIDNRRFHIQELMQFWEGRTNKLQFSNFTKQFSLSFYWSALTLVTLGEQPPPDDTFQNCYEIIVTLVGLVVFAVIVGDISYMITNMDTVRGGFEEMVDGCKRFMIYRGVPSKLQERTISWFDYAWNQKESTIDDKDIETFLPYRLYGSLAASIHMVTFRKIKLFENCDSSLLYELILMLRNQTYSPLDYVCRKGEVGKEMYIVKEGQLEIVSDDGAQVFTTISAGAVFGELSILDIPGNKNGNKRTASVRSVGYSNLYVLDKDKLWEVLEEYPQARTSLIEKGRVLVGVNELATDNIV